MIFGHMWPNAAEATNKLKFSPKYRYMKTILHMYLVFGARKQKKIDTLWA
jgi:hypothetical protein